MPRGSSGDDLFYGGDMESLEAEATPSGEDLDKKAKGFVQTVFDAWSAEGSGMDVHPRGVGIYEDLSLPFYYAEKEGPEEQEMEAHIASREGKPALELCITSPDRADDLVIYSGDSVVDLFSIGQRQAIEWGNGGCFASSAKDLVKKLEDLARQASEDVW